MPLRPVTARVGQSEPDSEAATARYQVTVTVTGDRNRQRLTGTVTQDLPGTVAPDSESRSHGTGAGRHRDRAVTFRVTGCSTGPSSRGGKYPALLRTVSRGRPPAAAAAGDPGLRLPGRRRGCPGTPRQCPARTRRLQCLESFELEVGTPNCLCPTCDSPSPSHGSGVQ